MDMLKEEILKALREFFEDLRKKDRLDVKRIEWELDNIIYPQIGSFIASGELSRDDGKEIFEFCERMLKDLKSRRG